MTIVERTRKIVTNKYGLTMASKDSIVILSDKTINELWDEIFNTDVVCFTVQEESEWRSNKEEIINFTDISIRSSTIESIYYITENCSIESED